MTHLSFLSARDKLKTARNAEDGKPLENNTRLRKVDENTFAVRLHNTDVVTIHRNGTYTLNSGGWRTVTTKDRINAYSPVRVYSDKGIWKLYKNGVAVALFHDGIVVDSCGNPVGKHEHPDARDSMKKRLNKAVKLYIDGFVKCVEDGSLNEPSGGDCWGCAFRAPEQREAMGLDHYFGHFAEPYFVPSLLMNAIRSKGYSNPALIWRMIVDNKDAGLARNALQYHFRKLGPALLAHVTEAAENGRDLFQRETAVCS